MDALSEDTVIPRKYVLLFHGASYGRDFFVALFHSDFVQLYNAGLCYLRRVNI